MDTDYRADVIFEHESHEFHEYFWHTDGHRWTRIYRADGGFLNTNIEYFWDTDTHSKFAENIRVIREIRVQK